MAVDRSRRWAGLAEANLFATRAEETRLAAPGQFLGAEFSDRNGGERYPVEPNAECRMPAAVRCRIYRLGVRRTAIVCGSAISKLLCGQRTY